MEKNSNIKNQNKKNILLLNINNRTTTNNILGTNSTEFITKNNKTESNDENYNSIKYNTQRNLNTENNNKFNKRNFELNIINTLKKDIEIWKTKLIILIKKSHSTIPENIIYSSLMQIIEALKKDKTNKFFGDIEDDKLIDNMMTLPVQNKQFRKLFLELLFRNKNIFDAVRRGQNNELDKYFKKNIFGAEKIKK